MTTANTMEIVEDILRLMDERPEVLEAVRARVLTRELLEMPERMTRLEATVAELAVTTREHTAILKEHSAILKEHSARFDRVDARLDRIETTVNQMRGEFGNLKGNNLEQKAKGQVSEIARQAGDYKFIEKLTSDDLYEMHRDADTTGISNNSLKSFRLSDIIMRVEDGEGETCYITVEASYTADDRDTDRAGRNAKLLTRFTGCPAIAVIASVHLDRRIEWIRESDDFFWYEMDEPR